MFEDKNILAVQCSDTKDEKYALFCDDKGLYHGSDKDGFTLIAVLENISLLDRPVKIYYHFPYIAVTERYGLNAATVNITDGSLLYFAREDYHCDVSSYSIGFLEREGRVLLIHQTQWNRLDITDLKTGELLTEREIIYRATDETETNQWGTFPKMESKNYIDYFHSLLHVSPDGRHFLSNGWIWQPFDNIMCFETERFLTEYENCGEHIEYYRGYSWDRPCAFVGNDKIVIAADEDEATYHQLLFYNLSEIKSRAYTYSGYENYDTLPLAYSGKAGCDVFTFDEYGEIEAGEIHYDPETNHLIALSGKGAFELTLDGEIVHSDYSIKLLQNWQYDAVRCSFYRFNENKIEKKCILRERLDRILKKVDYLKSLDKEYTVFGSWKHKYMFGKPLSEDVIVDFEKKYNVKLPRDYRLFLLEAGSGGAGPFFGIEPFEKSLFFDLDYPDEKHKLDPSVAFPHREAWNMDFDWDQGDDEDREGFEADYYDCRHITGAIRICNFGCAHYINLVVNGEEYSHIWSDDRASDYGIYPFNYYKVKDKERLSFFDWYEAWFDQKIEELK